jgi:phage terminase large subunit-like protein
MAKQKQSNPLAAAKYDPVLFTETVLVNPETDQPFILYPEQKSFMRAGFTLKPDGTLPYSELLRGGPKKSGKTAEGALALLYCVCAIGGRGAEGYCIANDFEQAQSRVFAAAVKIVRASPLLYRAAHIYSNKIEFPSTGASITAIASEYAGAAGANPTITVFDELWGFMSERGHRLWDEMVPVPTRKVSVRLTVTYAGFTGESDLLEGQYKRGLKGSLIARDLYAQPGMLMYWTHDCHAPWQTEVWKEQMRSSLRGNAYLRLIENRWVTSESPFIELEAWDKCVDPTASPIPRDKRLPVWIGVDASTKHDSTAIVACTYDERTKHVRLVSHVTFQPSPDDPLDFEQTIERTLVNMAEQYDLQEVRYDPWQLVSVAQRLIRAGIPMVEFPQTVGNLTEASSNLFELVRGGSMTLYADSEMRLAASRAVAIETSRGWRIGKEKKSHKIDVVVALAQAALGAVRGKGGNTVTIRYGLFGGYDDQPSPDPSDISPERGVRFEKVTEDEMNYLATLKSEE